MKPPSLANPLGITWYTGRRIVSQKFPQLRCASDEDFETVYKMVKLFCSNGGNVELNMDNKCYPMSQMDKDKYKHSHVSDPIFFKRILERMKKDFPGKRIVYCPPFYYGPASKAPTPDKRDTYLTKMGELPENKLEIKATAKGAHTSGPPFFMLNYAVIRKTGK
ncbi:MAG: hypothetical protein GY750_12220 [Lentisphaerae bacterium]|nr:hypothetical protein [Lentisphaerota bacterium]MCP4102179.1 hypothetical protein [Lentisphaerota bacterium]